MVHSSPVTAIQEIKLADKNFPYLLKNIPSPPAKIFFLGTLPELTAKVIAVVGTRKASTEGRFTAKTIARDLAEAGVIIASGLALGIDGAAHEGALQGKGKTLAVLGNGLNFIYPRSHESLARRILETNGAILSEYPPETPAYPNQFLERNRLISGLSAAVIIVECPLPSGAWNTAEHALAQGREVFVIPGPAHHPNYRGSHTLIRNGARLVTSAAEVLEDLNWAPEKTVCSTTAHSDPVSQKIIDIIVAAPSSIDNVAELTRIEPHILRQKITFLILEGIIEESRGLLRLK